MSELFPPLGDAQKGDWLAEHREPDETFNDFKRSRYNRAVRDDSLDSAACNCCILQVPKKNILYLQPIGDFPAGLSPSLETLRELATIFMGLETRVLPSLEMKQTAGSAVLKRAGAAVGEDSTLITCRTHRAHNVFQRSIQLAVWFAEGAFQLLTSDITDMLLATRPK